MPTLDFYRDRADEARLAAGTTTLENVRDRHLRSAAAWEEMADRAARTARHREEEAIRRTLRDDAAAFSFARTGH